MTGVPGELVRDVGAWAEAPASVFLTSSQEIPGLSGAGESLTAQGHRPTPETPEPGRFLQIPSPRRCPDLFVILCSLIKPNPPSSAHLCLLSVQ